MSVLRPQNIKLEIKQRARKFQNTWRLNNKLLNNKSVKEEVAREIFKPFN